MNSAIKRLIGVVELKAGERFELQTPAGTYSVTIEPVTGVYKKYRALVEFDPITLDTIKFNEKWRRN